MIHRTTGVQRRLIDGKADSYEQYKEWAGWVKGVLDVFDAPEKLQESLKSTIAQIEEREKLAE